VRRTAGLTDESVCPTLVRRRLRSCGARASACQPRFSQVLRRLFRLVIALLRELADESAYQRHLTAHGLTHSGEEWRRFSEQRLRERYSQAKCC
jgi:hypothetical protein